MATSVKMENQPRLPLARPDGPARRQTKILMRCVADGLDLDAELARYGMDREDLRYIDDSRSAPSRARVWRLDDFRLKSHGIPVVSFFSGCGGMDLGLEAAGFGHVALVEHNALFASTLRHNRPGWGVVAPPDFGGDVSASEELAAILETRFGVGRPFEGLFVGGPPCQPFSIAANQRFNKGGDNFKRVGFHHGKNGNLLFDMLWQVERFRPRAFLIENVEGLYDVDGGQQLQRAINDLASWGYSVNPPMVLDAAHYRVPQHRRRLFLVGSRVGLPFLQPKPCFDLIPCEAALRGVAGLPNHEPRSHKAESLLRYMILGYGERDHLGRVDRLDPCVPSKTVIAGGLHGGGRSHLHPKIPRTLTPRECARLQTFPDDFVLLGPSARQFTQNGNAVPPVLAAQLGAAIFRSFFRGSEL
jgi:DNA (cytosine-5)-methyltransferase 1